MVTLRSIILSRAYSTLRLKIRIDSAVFTTMVLTNLATLFMLLQAIYQISSHFLPRTTIYPVDGFKTKQVDIYALNLASDALAFFFGVTAALNVSLVWIEITQRVEEGKALVHINIFFYRKLLIAYNVLFGIFIIILMAIGDGQYVFILAAPALIFIVITYLWGWRLFSKLVYSILHRNHIGEVHSSESSLLVALYNIRITSLGISITLFFAIVSAILQSFTNNYNRPDNSAGAIPGRIFWVFVSLSMAFLANYTSTQVEMKRKGVVTTTTGGATDLPLQTTNPLHQQSRQQEVKDPETTTEKEKENTALSNKIDTFND